MKGLLIKDFKLLKNQKSFFLIICVIGIIFLMTSAEPAFVISYTTFIFAMFTLSTISYDEYDNGSAFLFSLPVSRSKYVKEKYVFGLLLGGGAWLASTIVCSVYRFARFPGEGKTEWIVTAVTYLAVYLIILSLILPVQLKFGSEKSRIAMIGTVGAVFAVAFVLYKLFQYLNIDLDELLTRLSNSTPLQVLAFVFLICGIALFISYCVSQKIMGKKEF